VILIIFLFYFVSGCIDNDEKSKFLGTWISGDETEEYEFTFYENNSFYSYYVYHFNDGTNENHKGRGEYEITNDQKIRMFTSHGMGGAYDEETYSYDFIDSNHLELTTSTNQKYDLIKVN